jgi:hypothetical protein
MHLFRDVVLGPGRSGQDRDFLESEHAVTCRVEQDQPVSIIIAAVGGDLIAGALPQAEESPVELGESPTVGSVESGVHKNGMRGHLRPPATASEHRHLSIDIRFRDMLTSACMSGRSCPLIRTDQPDMALAAAMRIVRQQYRSSPRRARPTPAPITVRDRLVPRARGDRRLGAATRYLARTWARIDHAFAPDSRRPLARRRHERASQRPSCDEYSCSPARSRRPR